MSRAALLNMLGLDQSDVVKMKKRKCLSNQKWSDDLHEDEGGAEITEFLVILDEDTKDLIAKVASRYDLSKREVIEISMAMIWKRILQDMQEDFPV
jgi:ribosomal protein S25